jgi:hypothetical protein
MIANDVIDTDTNWKGHSSFNAFAVDLVVRSRGKELRDM